MLNIGNHRPESVRYLVSLLEAELGRKANLRLLPRPQADVEKTWASIDAIQSLTGWHPTTVLEEGVQRFVSWFRTYEKLTITV